MKRRLVLLLLLLVLGAIVNVAVAWCAFPGKPEDFGVVQRVTTADQTDLVARGVPRFDDVDSAELQTFGLEDSTFSTYVDRTLNKYPLQYARLIEVGWPCRSLFGMRWSPIRFDAATNQHRFTGEQNYVGAILVNVQNVMHGEREFLPTRPIWPGFAINTVFYAVVLWLLFAGPFVLRRRRRIRRGLCPKCAYDLRGTPEGATACPECGAQK